MAILVPEQPASSPWSNPAAVLAGRQLNRVNKFHHALATCGSGEKAARICQRIRDDLLSEHRNLEIVFAVCRDLMKDSKQAFIPHGPDWERFTDIANKGAKVREKCIKALKVVADRWGYEALYHYGWGALGPGFCDQLRAAAREMDWPTFVKLVNQVLLSRHRSPIPEVMPVPAHVNPITRADLVEVRRLVKVSCAKRQRAKAKDPAAQEKHEADYKAAKVESEDCYRTSNKLPEGFGLDRFGILVRGKFDDPLKSCIPSPAAPEAPPMERFLGTFQAEAADVIPPRSLIGVSNAGRIPLPLPPSPPSSPKRAAPEHPDQARKRQRTRPPKLGAVADAKKIYDLLAQLQSKGSPLLDQPQFAQALEWAKEECGREEEAEGGDVCRRETIAASPAPRSNPAVASSPTTALSYLDRVLSPPVPRPCERTVMIQKRIIEEIVVTCIESIASDIWYLNTSTPPIISLRLPKSLIQEHGDGEELAISGPMNLGGPIRGTVRIVPSTDFRELVGRHGFGRTYWNQVEEDAFVTLEVLDPGLVALFDEVGKVDRPPTTSAHGVMV